MQFEEGSPLDPFLFGGRPKPKRYVRPANLHVEKINVKKALEPVKTGIGLYKRYRETQSPSYQLAKARRKLNEYRDAERLVKVRSVIAEKEAKLKEQRSFERKQKFEAAKRFLRIKRSIYD